MRSGSFRQPLWCNDPAAVIQHPQYLIMSLDDLLKTPGDLEALDLSSRHHTATYLLSGLEQILRTLAKAMSNGSFIYHSPGDTGETPSCSAPAPGPPHTPRAPDHCPLSPQSCP